MQIEKMLDLSFEGYWYQLQFVLKTSNAIQE